MDWSLAFIIDKSCAVGFTHIRTKLISRQYFPNAGTLGALHCPMGSLLLMPFIALNKST